MWELARDSRNGQVSERERQMRQIDWDEVKQKRREAEDQLVADAQERQERNREQRYIQLGLALPDAGNDETEDAQAEDGTAEGESAGETAGETAEGETAETEQPTRAGPALRIVNGEIMLDEEAPEEAPPEDDYADILAQEDADLTVRRNRMVGINNRRREPADRLPPARKRGGKTRNGAWTTEETDMLYQHMRMWGTDFEMIAQMMPNRTRAQVKRKFLAEEKLDPVRMRETFMAKPIPMSIDYYAEHTGRDKSVYTQYEGLDDCMNQIKETVADVRRQKEQREEEARQQVQKDQDEAEARKASAKRKREGKKRKREAEVQLEDE
ncbi:hypothetical protein K470DRAFT_264108 [Piedraia hortae CBS 480.64]|uniref:Myb-like domain-containing protein n=1 Tax=Piedraia hortae CBS 480.64 TaxID=1314780 RepID=A0A6A7C077_9PEZI|nr:hypothetical protein K470DRAFT_264108 [Piedraia hortae CBS 480.64]